MEGDRNLINATNTPVVHILAIAITAFNRAHQAPDSAIGEHLVVNVGCLNAYHRKQSTIFTVARTQSRLDTLETLLIRKFKPQLCTRANQKNLSVVYTFSRSTLIFIHAHTCTHPAKTSHSPSHFFCRPSHTHTSTNPHSAIHTRKRTTGVLAALISFLYKLSQKFTFADFHEGEHCF